MTGGPMHTINRADGVAETTAWRPEHWALTWQPFYWWSQDSPRNCATTTRHGLACPVPPVRGGLRCHLHLTAAEHQAIGHVGVRECAVSSCVMPARSGDELCVYHHAATTIEVTDEPGVTRLAGDELRTTTCPLCGDFLAPDDAICWATLRDDLTAWLHLSCTETLIRSVLEERPDPRMVRPQ